LEPEDRRSSFSPLAFPRASSVFQLIQRDNHLNVDSLGVLSPAWRPNNNAPPI
jgi:hypothetical protein